MLTRTQLETSGQFLFRWRGQAPLVFLPWLCFALTRGEPVEHGIFPAAAELVELLAAALIVGGLILRAITVGHAPGSTSGRNTHAQVAEVLNTTGMYSICRNPLYVGNAMTYVGLAVLAQDLMLALVMTLALTLYYERIVMAEERFLEGRFGRVYTDWADRVPAFLPRLSGWTPPELSFCIRTVLRREYPGWLAAISLSALVVAGQDMAEGEALADLMPFWVAAALSAGACVLLFVLKKRTRLLHVEGR